MFDPYHKWLGIPLEQRPPTYYQLLGISPDERDPEVIEEAAIRQSAHVRVYQMGPHAAESARLLSEIAQARSTLLKPAKRQEYDAQLNKDTGSKTAARKRSGRETVRSSTAAEPPPLPAAAPKSAPPSSPFAVGSVKTNGHPRPGSARAVHAAAKGGNWLVMGAIGCIVILLVGGGLAFWLLKTSRQPGHAHPNGDHANVDTPGDPGPSTQPPSKGNTNTTPPKEPPHEPRRFEGHTSPITCVAFSPDGKYVASGSGAHAVRDGKSVFVDCSVRLWDVDSGKEVRRFDGHLAPLQAIAFSPNGRLLLTASGYQETRDEQTSAFDCKMRLWDVQSGQLLNVFDGFTGIVRGVAFLNDTQALSAAADNSVRVWDVENYEELHSFDHSPGPVKSLAVAPEGRWVLTGHVDRLAQLWDVTTGQPVRRFQGFKYAVHCVAFSPDARLALIGSGALVNRDGQATPVECAVGLWDVAKAEKVRDLEGPTGPVRAVLFCPDGRHALSAGDDRMIRLWDTETGKQVRQFEGHKAAVMGLALAPDGRQILSGSVDKGLRLWGLPDDLVVSKPKGKPRPVDPDPPSPPMPERMPVPDKEDQDKAEKVVKEVFKVEYAKTKLPDIRSLAEKLLLRGRATQDDPAARYVLFRESHDLAVRIGDADLALLAIDELDSDYAVDGLEMKLAVLDKVVKMASPPATNKKVIIDTAQLVMDDAMAADKYDLAKRLLDLADATARKTNVPALMKTVQARAKDLARQRKEYEDVQKAVEVLKKQPEDAASNLTVGRYLCLVRGKWDQGVPLLCLGSDDKLKAVGEKEAAKPVEPLLRAEVGEAWWELSKNEEGATRLQMQRRAYYWYKLALPELTGLKEDQVKQRLTDLAKFLPEQPGKWDHLDVSKASVMSGFVRINRHRAIATKDHYSGQLDITVVVRTEKDNIRINALQGAAVIFNDPAFPRQMRVCRPDGQVKKLESGSLVALPLVPLAPNKWHTIRWRITEKKMEIWVNDIQVFIEKRNYDLGVEQAVRVRAMDSVLDLKSLEVKRLQ